ncbi:MAG: universal stress protein [Burkholderiales bacterium]|nr:MAG: universal stress protein [Burkholderiales bacterium]
MESQLSPTGRFERIMLATDGSDSAAGAERVAFAMAEEWKATLQLMSVVISNPAAIEAAPAVIEAADEKTRLLLDGLYENAVKRAIAAERIVRRGTEPTAEILTAAEKNHSDVIVVGRSQQRGMLKRFLGDRVSRIIGGARCSVLVVPPDASMWRSRILLATDGSRFSDAAGVVALRLAQLCKLPVTVISVVRESFTEERAAQAEQAAVRMNEHLAKEGIEIDRVVLSGDPATLIAQTADTQQADLIVMGTHGRTGWERVRVGSVTDQVVGQSTCAVLAVKG